MAHTLSHDVATLLDSLSLLPAFRGDWNDNGERDPAVRVPRFWAAFLDATGRTNASSADRQSAHEGQIYYMEKKLTPYIKSQPDRAYDAAEFASYCLMFFAVTENRLACELLGKQFTPHFEMPDGNEALGRRWANELVTVAWRIYRSIGKPIASPDSLAPGRTIPQSSSIREPD